MAVVMVNHNYPTTDSMTVVNADGDPVEGVAVRIFEPTAFYSDHVDTWIAQTETDIEGKWIDPIALTSASTYVVHFQKESMYGPTHIEITT